MSGFARTQVNEADVFRKAPFLVSSETGLPLQGDVPKSSVAVTADGAPEILKNVHLMDASGGAVTLTFPADMSDYVGRTMTFVCAANPGGNDCVVACAAGQLAGFTSVKLNILGAATDTTVSVTIFISSPTAAHVIALTPDQAGTLPTIA